MVGAGIDEFFVLGADAPGRLGLFARGHGRGELVAVGYHDFLRVGFLPGAHDCSMRFWSRAIWTFAGSRMIAIALLASLEARRNLCQY